MTYEQIKNDPAIRTYITQADASLCALGYTEHSFAHVTRVAEQAGYILQTVGCSPREVELAKIAGFLHDIGNLVNRIEHSQSGAVMAFRILDNLGFPPEEIALITGQRPVVTKARKSIANFKVRQGMPVGAKVTLRGDNMYEFIDKLINIALPRVRDFKGVSKNSFDGRGNYSMGIKEQLIFPEINYDKVDTIKGMNIVFTTTAKTDEEAQALLADLGMPFEK